MTWEFLTSRKVIYALTSLSLFCFIMASLSYAYGMGLIKLPEPMSRWFSPSQEADVTITYTPAFGVGPPTGLTLTYVTDYLMRVDWTKGYSANRTMIRASFNDFPANVTDGYLLYHDVGVSTNDTAINWYDNAGTIYVSGFSDNYSGMDNVTWSYSLTFDTAELENPIVADVASAITGLTAFFTGNIDDIIGLIIVLALAVLAVWRGHRPFYMVSGFAFMIYGFSYWTTTTYLSILLVLIGLFMIGKSLVRQRKESD